MCAIAKIRYFHSFLLIHNQNLKNSPDYYWDIYLKKLATQFNKFHGGLFELDILEIFTTDFLRKLDLFFKYWRLPSLKLKNKTSLKRCKPPKNCLTWKDADEIREKKKEKWEKVKQEQ